MIAPHNSICCAELSYRCIMKIDRIIAILSILSQKEKVTASELAERFEVSRRTILRDIEHLNRSGIPIVTVQGNGGGISVMESYRMDKTLISSTDMQSILAGLKSLDSVSGDNGYRMLMDKLCPKITESVKVDDTFIIDLSIWDKSIIAEKIDVFKSAIKENKVVFFRYYSANGESVRKIEPYHLIFQWSSWYVWGYCTEKNDYRMFKLTRIDQVNKTDIVFEPRDIPQYTCDKLRHAHGGQCEITVKFDSSVRWRLIDEWGSNSFKTDKNGDIIVKFTWADKLSLYNWLLTFSDKAIIISPIKCREEFLSIVQRIANKYNQEITE